MRQLWLAAAALYAGLVLATFSLERAAFASQALDETGFGNFSPLKPRSTRPRAAAAPERRTTYQKIERVPGGYAVEFGFKNFDGAGLRVADRLSEEDVAASVKEFGFRRQDFENLDWWYEQAQKAAIADAEKRLFRGKVQGKTQAEVDEKLRRLKAANEEIQKGLERELARLASEYRERRVEVYRKAGFKFKDKNTVEADIPGLAGRNWKRLRGLARSFNEAVDEHGYGMEELVGAGAAWVQTSLRYEVPQTQEGSRVVAGVLPPLKAVVLGQGDCDTKSALLASLLLNWPNLKIVGLGIPEHYLMAVHRIPRRGEVFIEYEGLPYVMIESAGPAWLAPGTVGDQTLAYLKAGNNFRIQPITASGS